MDQNRLKKNSNTSQNTEREAIKPVIKANQSSQKPASGRLSDVFGFGNLKGLGAKIMKDTLLPTFKDVLDDVTTATKDRLIYGDNPPVRAKQRARGQRGALPAGHMDYTNRYRGGMQPTTRPPMRSRAATPSVNLLFDTYEAAFNVLEAMQERSTQYGNITIAEYCALTAVQPQPLDNQYGWFTIDVMNAVVIQSGRGYLIDIIAPAAL